MNEKLINNLDINVLSREQYETARQNETLDENALYMVKESDYSTDGLQERLDTIEELIEDGDKLEIRELIWVNPNPDTAFANQTINESLNGWVEGKVYSDYSSFEIEYRNFSGYTSRQTMRFNKGENGDIRAVCGSTGQWTGNLWVGVRNLSVNNSGISIFGGIQSSSAGAWSARQEACVPTRVFGIKIGKRTYNQNQKSVDYIIDEGTEGNWTWVKWNSGKMEEWYSEKKTISITGAQVSKACFCGTITTGLTFPKTFIEAPNFTYNMSSNSGSPAHFMSSSYITTTSTGKVNIYRLASGGASPEVNYTLKYIGRWKLEDSND